MNVHAFEFAGAWPKSKHTLNASFFTAMEPDSKLKERYCMQCCEYLDDMSPEHDCHDQVALKTEACVLEDTLCSLLMSLFTAYSERPCLGIPTKSSVQWKWVSYSQLKNHAISYAQSLKDYRKQFLVASFSENCLELVAFDIAAALLGACSVIAQGEERAREIVASLGATKCHLVSLPSMEASQGLDSQEDKESLLWTGGDEDVLFSLFATSGSSGTPKLVRRTRASWLETVRDPVQFNDHLCVTLNFTSFVHSASRTELWWNIACGGQTALADPQFKLLDSFASLSPTEIAAPPAVWSEIRRDLISERISDLETLQKKKGKLLRNLHTVSTGSASCERNLFDFLKKMFGNDTLVLENYGTTEIGCIAVNGELQEGLKVKLVQIPEQGIFSPRGEVCIEADGVFEGYYFQCEALMTEDGYYRTGDIAEKIPGGEIRIVGRLSNMVKLSNGKFESLDSVDMQILEALQADLSCVEQVCTLEIFGSLAAVVYAPGQTKLPTLWVPCICAREKFTVENGMLTPSLKLCRRAIQAKHESELRRLIEERHGRVYGVLESLTSLNGASIDETCPLRDYGVTSVHFAKIASSLGIPVHLISGASTLRDLKCIASDGLGSKAALADIELSIQHARKLVRLDSKALQKFAEGTWKNMKKIVVTGATGQIGSCFVELLRGKGLTVISIACSLGYDISMPQFGMSDQLYADCAQSDAVIHCAAIVNWSASYPDIREPNVLSIVNIAKLCIDGKPKALLFVGSGVAFPEETPCFEWLEECANPYMVSKIASEILIRTIAASDFLRIPTLVVRAGTVVWHSVTGAHKSSDAYVRLVKAIVQDRLTWEEDDLMDGINVDTFCSAAFSLFEQLKFDTFNLHGTYRMSGLFKHLNFEPKRIPYSTWYKTLFERCTEDHPLTPLLPHIEEDSPPFVAESNVMEHNLSPKCKELLGLSPSVAGYEAFAKAIASGKSARQLPWRWVHILIG